MKGKIMFGAGLRVAFEQQHLLDCPPHDLWIEPQQRAQVCEGWLDEAHHDASVNCPQRCRQQDLAARVWAWPWS